MYSLSRPDPLTIERFIRQREAAPAFQSTGGIPQPAPTGFRFNHGTGPLGTGMKTFQAARDAMRDWQMFPPWAYVRHFDRPPTAGQTVAVTAQCLGVWTTDCCRIVDVTDRENCFAFTYATVEDHAVSGAERFAVYRDRATDRVTYEVASIARPSHWIIWVAYYWFRRIQKRFARESPAVLRAAVERRLQQADSQLPS